jgi:hypothetical protein
VSTDRQDRSGLGLGDRAARCACCDDGEVFVMGILPRVGKTRSLKAVIRFMPADHRP